MKKTFKYIFLSFIIFFTIFISYTIYEAPKIDFQKEFQNKKSEGAKIVNTKGEVEYYFYPNREYVERKDISEDLIKILINTEDRNFYKHHGVNVKSILASILQNIKSRKIVRGGSTIDQQLIKNMYLTNEKSISRKIKEAYLAVKMNKDLTKDEILELYINKVWLGHDVYGFANGANFYFNKNLNELNKAELSLLVATLNAPSKYKPFKLIRKNIYTEEYLIKDDIKINNKLYKCVFNSNVDKKLDVIFKSLLNNNIVDEEEYEDLINYDIRKSLVYSDKKENINNDLKLVKEDIIEDIMNDKKLSYKDALGYLKNNNLTFTSTIDEDLQNTLNKNIDEIINKYFNYSNIREIASINFSKNKSILDKKENTTNIKKSDLFKKGKVFLYPSEYEETAYNEIKLVNNDKIQILDKGIKFRDFYSTDKGFKLHRFEPIYFKEGEYYKKDDAIYLKDKTNIRNNISIDEDGYLYFNSEELVYDKEGQTQPQIAGIVIDNKNNKIIATINGRRLEENFINRSKIPRQVGSVIKPISVYLPILDKGKSINDYVVDEPYTTKDGYSPNNWYKGYRGKMNIEESLAESVNVTTVKLAEELGKNTIISYLEKLGLIYENDTFVTREENKNRNDENYSALALGGLTYGFTPRDIVSSYTVFSQKGEFEKPSSFMESKAKKNKVVSEEAVEGMNKILKTATRRNFSRYAYGIEGLRGKTGTTNDIKDLWYIGYNDKFTIGIWMGYDNQAITFKESNGSLVKVYKDIFNLVEENYKE